MSLATMIKLFHCDPEVEGLKQGKSFSTCRVRLTLCTSDTAQTLQQQESCRLDCSFYYYTTEIQKEKWINKNFNQQYKHRTPWPSLLSPQFTRSNGYNNNSTVPLKREAQKNTRTKMDYNYLIIHLWRNLGRTAITPGLASSKRYLQESIEIIGNRVTKLQDSYLHKLALISYHQNRNNTYLFSIRKLLITVGSEACPRLWLPVPRRNGNYMNFARPCKS